MKRGKKYIGRSIILMLALMVVTVVSCKKDSNDYKPMTPPTSGPPANEVWIQGNNSFNPSTLTVPVNTTVKWTNKDTYYTHTVTSDNGAFDSGVIAIGGTFSHQFTTAGTYNYHCTLHSMSAKVIVQ